MNYPITSTTALVEVDRTKIIDVAVGDTLQINGVLSGSYTWTEQDSQFMESNPDAQIFLMIKGNGSNDVVCERIVILPEAIAY